MKPLVYKDWWGGKDPLHLKTLSLSNLKIDVTPYILELKKCIFPKVARATNEQYPRTAVVVCGSPLQCLRESPRVLAKVGPTPGYIVRRSIYDACPRMCFRPPILKIQITVNG